jgi:putative Ca2+/H+ antiporter (TMEM165/GDT1 family)
MSIIAVFQVGLLALITVFIMELGDKTQLMAFTLALKHRAPIKVFLGVFIGLSSVTIISVVLGIILKNTVDIKILKPLISILFISGGIIFLVNELNNRNRNNKEIRFCPVSLDLCKKSHENCPEMDQCELYLDNTVRKGAFVTSASFMFFAELGDKTMIMALGLATTYDPIGVFIGALLALTLVNGVGVFVGDKVAARIPRQKLVIISGLLFIIMGILIFWF